MTPICRRKTIDQNQKQLQSVFKISSSNRIGLDRGGGGDASPNAPSNSTFRPRKSHKKSRTGCANCRVRRVKCDETRDGGCMKCLSHGIECDYLRSQPTLGKRLVQLHARPGGTPDDEGNSPHPRRLSGAPHANSLSNIQNLTNGSNDENMYTLVLSPSPRSLIIDPILEISTNASPRMTTPLASLHHFEEFTSYTCGSPQGQSIMQSCMALAVHTPYLMHAILGVAAAHMSFLLPPDVNAVQHARNKLADAYHWGHALALFRKELGGEGTMAGAGRENMDALLSTIMLVAIHQFSLHEDEERSSPDKQGAENWQNSFVFVEDDDERSTAMKWLTIQTGFKLLLWQLERYLAESVWLPVLEDATFGGHFETLTEIGASGDANSDEVEKLFFEICNITTESNEENNAYYGSLETVLCIRRLRPVRVELFNKLITVMGRITPALRRLIWTRDTAALLILCHWLSLMAGMKQWWIMARAHRECRAITMYLLMQELEEEGQIKIRKLLVEPARVVGIAI